MPDKSRTITKGVSSIPSPTPKNGSISEVEVLEGKKAAKEITVIHDHGFFLHTTGDTYDGEFEAKKKDLSVKMHGEGVYTTAEGDVYAGHWDSNKLVATGQAIISYNDGAKFEGTVSNFVYTGKGKYTYPDGSKLTGEFAENCPVGNLVLTDPNGHTWLGKAEHGYGWFEPVNHFYELLETTQPRMKRRHKNVLETATPSVKTNSPSPDKPTSSPLMAKTKTINKK